MTALRVTTFSGGRAVMGRGCDPTALPSSSRRMRSVPQSARTSEVRRLHPVAVRWSEPQPAREKPIPEDRSTDLQRWRSPAPNSAKVQSPRSVAPPTSIMRRPTAASHAIENSSGASLASVATAVRLPRPGADQSCGEPSSRTRRTRSTSPGRAGSRSRHATAAPSPVTTASSSSSLLPGAEVAATIAMSPSDQRQGPGAKGTSGGPTTGVSAGTTTAASASAPGESTDPSALDVVAVVLEEHAPP